MSTEVERLKKHRDILIAALKEAASAIEDMATGPEEGVGVAWEEELDDIQDAIEKVKEDEETLQEKQETVRDFQADLKVCNAASKKPWINDPLSDESDEGRPIIDALGKPIVRARWDGYLLQKSMMSEANRAFIVMAREALPYWMNKAQIWAERVFELERWAKSTRLLTTTKPQYRFTCPDPDCLFVGRYDRYDIYLWDPFVMVRYGDESEDYHVLNLCQVVSGHIARMGVTK